MCLPKFLVCYLNYDYCIKKFRMSTLGSVRRIHCFHSLAPFFLILISLYGFLLNLHSADDWRVFTSCLKSCLTDRAAVKHRLHRTKTTADMHHIKIILLDSWEQFRSDTVLLMWNISSCTLAMLRRSPLSRWFKVALCWAHPVLRWVILKWISWALNEHLFLEGIQQVALGTEQKWKNRRARQETCCCRVSCAQYTQ